VEIRQHAEQCEENAWVKAPFTAEEKHIKDVDFKAKTDFFSIMIEVTLK
jgi:hypothetical protein